LSQTSAPWTIGLLAVSTILAFVIGSVLGALLAWPNTSRLFNILVPLLMTLSAIPYYLLGLVLLYVLAFRLPIFPSFGGYTPGSLPGVNLRFFVDAVGHAFLPALSIILASLGFWALGMRAMMVSMQGEDSMIFAEAKGLKDSTLFVRYAMRNALLVDNVLVEATASHYGDRDDLIIQCTEMTTDAEMDALVAAIESIAASVRETVSAR